MGNNLVTKRTIAMVFTLAIAMIPIATAFDWEYTCNSSTTAKKYMEFTSCNATSCEDYNITQYYNCTYGCDNVTKVCQDSPFQTNLYIIIGIVVLMILVVLVMKK
jgi:hypothetical protein